VARLHFFVRGNPVSTNPKGLTMTTKLSPYFATASQRRAYKAASINVTPGTPPLRSIEERMVREVRATARKLVGVPAPQGIYHAASACGRVSVTAYNPFTEGLTPPHATVVVYAKNGTLLRAYDAIL
jgi:hypothetical protein